MQADVVLALTATIDTVLQRVFKVSVSTAAADQDTGARSKVRRAASPRVSPCMTCRLSTRSRVSCSRGTCNSLYGESPLGFLPRSRLCRS